MGGDGRRTLLVVADEVDLFSALRPELDGAMLQVSWSDVQSCAERVAAYVPWPWAICGVGTGPDAAAFARVIGRPVIWFWLGTPPTWLPSHRRAHASWPAVLADARTCVARSLGGLRLAPNRGLIGPGGELVLSAELEALVATSPDPVTVSARSEASVRRVLQRRHLTLPLVRENSVMRIGEAA